jgi:hypothetical protein
MNALLAAVAGLPMVTAKAALPPFVTSKLFVELAGPF